MKKIFIAAVLFLITFSRCEKDDICAEGTPTTPQVVIEFFDSDSQLPINVSKLEVNEFGTSKILNTFDGVSKIKLPLKTMSDLTKYTLKLNAGNTNTALINEVHLQFDYIRHDLYVSRACGYKTLFVLNLNSPTFIDSTPANGSWIESIVILKPNILDENETHIKIFL